jgi:hypothetical protein
MPGTGNITEYCMICYLRSILTIAIIYEVASFYYSCKVHNGNIDLQKYFIAASNNNYLENISSKLIVTFTCE